MPNIWPPLPLLVCACETETLDMDNTIAALERSDRVREISINMSGPQSEKVLKAMEEPFPELTFLELESIDELEQVSALPNSFLGVSAPRLQTLILYDVPFPGLPKLLLSVANLAELSLGMDYPSGYISPEAMVTGLSALTRLERLFLGFGSSYLAPKREACRRRHTLSFPPSPALSSKGPANTWITSWPASMSLDSMTSL